MVSMDSPLKLEQGPLPWAFSHARMRARKELPGHCQPDGGSALRPGGLCILCTLSPWKPFASRDEHPFATCFDVHQGFPGFCPTATWVGLCGELAPPQKKKRRETYFRLVKYYNSPRSTETIVRWYLQGRHQTSGFLKGGAK